MTNEIKSRITKFFREHQDGDFIRSAPTYPTVAIPKTDATRGVLYSTKPAVVSRATEHCLGGSLAIIGGGGLPSDEQLDSVRTVCDGAPVGFLGDCDPVDLMIFAALRNQIDMKYVGVSDALVGDFNVDVTNNMTIRLSDSESKAFACFPEFCADHEALIGPECSALWRDGRKLELEAVFNFARVDAAHMFSALRLTG